jgi:adenylate kinase family enzyme
MKSTLKNYIKEFLNEGKHDQNIYKCVIVLGPAGVGKSTAIRKIVGGTGLKYLNADQFLELDIEKVISGSENEELKKTKIEKQSG